MLPVTSAFEAEGLKVGFEISERGAVTGAAATAGLASARRGPLGHPDHLRARYPARPRRALLGRGRRCGLASPARAERGDARAAARGTCGGARAPRRPATRSSPSSTATRAAGLQHADGQDRAVLGGAGSTTATRRCPSSSSRRTSPVRGPTCATRSRSSSRARSRCGSARPSIATSPACAAACPTRRSSCTRTPRPRAASRTATGCGSARRKGSVRARAKLNAKLDPSVVVRPARLVAGLRRARSARLPAVRPGQRQPQPRAQPDSRATRSAAARPCARRCARSRRWRRGEGNDERSILPRPSG